MGNVSRLFLVSLLLRLFQIQTKVFCYQYKVGDLDAWGIPTSANPQIYAKWSKYHNLTLGDSLLFLYPPSQDSVIQVTKESYESCNLKNPILYMNNGNSLFNITSNGSLYFTSGESGRCQKNQKLHIIVGIGGNNENSDGALSPSSLPANAPSYNAVFGNIPFAPSSPNSSPQLITSISQLLFIGSITFPLFFLL